MAIDTSQWPTPDNYSFAMGNLHLLAKPQWLKTAEVERDDFGNICMTSNAGLYTCTFKVKLALSPENPSGQWMTRCFCTTGRGHPPGDITLRYLRIRDFCNGHLSSVSALLYVHYVEQALVVPFIDKHTPGSRGEKVVPLVLMPFVDDVPTLGEYIANHYQSRERMEELCRAWLKMLKEMHQAQMAHGDLDLTNVLVQERGNTLQLKLIDYDNMWVPKLLGFPQTELGKIDFQHPTLVDQRSRPYDDKMDRFAALSIYISIRALSLYPELYEECKVDEDNHLLFTQEDYRGEIDQKNYLKGVGPTNSPYLTRDVNSMGTIMKLVNRNNPDLFPYLTELCYALYYNCMPIYNVYDVPPDHGQYGMPEPIPETSLVTTTVPVIETMESVPDTAPRPHIDVPTRPQKSSKGCIVAIVVILLIIAIATVVYLIVQAHNSATHSGGWLPLPVTLQHWVFSLAEIIGRRII